MSSVKVGKYSFDWTDHHLFTEETGPLRYEYDELGSNTVKILQLMQKLKDTAVGEGPPSRFDMYAALRDHHSEHETLSKLWTEVNTVPPWVDWHQIERGQKFFYRYAIANLTGFALQGFVGENSAASGVVEVLVRTGGFSTSLLRRRLLETFQFILQVTKDVDAIKPGGEGHISAVRVRLLHGAVRERIMKLVEARPDYFNVEKFGVPINTLDSIHSISTFCCNHMWLQLPLMGVHPSQQEMADYIALFRYVGYLLATPDKYFASVATAKATMESMLLHERELTDTSRVVGYNFVQCLKDMPPFNISADFIAAGSRVLNCDEFCDLLGFHRPRILPYACFQGLCWFVRGLALAQQGCPRLDETVVDYSRKLLHRAIITSKSGLGRASKLDFKYVPQLGKLTGRENNDRPASASLFSRPVESFFFCFFLVIVLSSLLVAGSIILLFSL
ncbi:hypothetical protein PWT90_00399 [Aphanocladium album]|nr:hypothetical protein PWT90_00399 [Aphanocladium album]